jgi:hypothetical protein
LAPLTAYIGPSDSYGSWAHAGAVARQSPNLSLTLPPLLRCPAPRSRHRRHDGLPGRRADGESIYRPHGTALYATRTQPSMEDQLLSHAQQESAPNLPPLLVSPSLEPLGLLIVAQAAAVLGVKPTAA